LFETLRNPFRWPVLQSEAFCDAVRRILKPEAIRLQKEIKTSVYIGNSPKTTARNIKTLPLLNQSSYEVILKLENQCP